MLLKLGKRESQELEQLLMFVRRFSGQEKFEKIADHFLNTLQLSLPIDELEILENTPVIGFNEND